LADRYPPKEPEFDCAYLNARFPRDYPYRDRVIGHAMENGSRIFSVAAFLGRDSTTSALLAIRRIELNRDGGGGHVISAVPIEANNVELHVKRGRPRWNIHCRPGL